MATTKRDGCSNRACYQGKWIPTIISQQYGGEAFREKVIDNPHSFMSFIMAYAKRSKNLSYENDVLQYIHEVLEELAKRPSPVERDLIYSTTFN